MVLRSHGEGCVADCTAERAQKAPIFTPRSRAVRPARRAEATIFGLEGQSPVSFAGKK